jgi:hypothetical protein
VHDLRTYAQACHQTPQNIFSRMSRGSAESNCRVTLRYISGLAVLCVCVRRALASPGTDLHLSTPARKTAADVVRLLNRKGLDISM